MPKPRIKTADEEIPKRSKQRPLPGMERAVAKDVEEAADAFVNIRDRRLALSEKETEAQATLLAAMKAHRLQSYRYDENLVVVDSKEKVRVKNAKDELEELDDYGSQ